VAFAGPHANRAGAGDEAVVSEVWPLSISAMDKAEAKKIISEQLLRFRNYTDLLPLVESRHVEGLEVRSASGTAYQVEVNFFWEIVGDVSFESWDLLMTAAFEHSCR
jgi:hypothetical protein